MIFDVDICRLLMFRVVLCYRFGCVRHVGFIVIVCRLMLSYVVPCCRVLHVVDMCCMLVSHVVCCCRVPLADVMRW